jgi:hypothetical protein
MLIHGSFEVNKTPAVVVVWPRDAAKILDGPLGKKNTASWLESSRIMSQGPFEGSESQR